MMEQSDSVKNWRSRAEERIRLNGQLHEVWMLLDDIEAGSLSMEEAHKRFKKLKES